MPCLTCAALSIEAVQLKTVYELVPLANRNAEGQLPAGLLPPSSFRVLVADIWKSRVAVRWAQPIIIDNGNMEIIITQTSLGFKARTCFHS